MALPTYLHAHQEEAQALLQRGAIEEIEFSSSTYRLQVNDGQNVYWVFLRLSEEEDAFCECDSEEACVHLAAAYLFIFKKPPLALHEHYQLSIWRHIALLYFEHYGPSNDCFKKIEEGCYEWNDGLFLLLKAQNKPSADFLHTLLEEREEETEKNSIKFSGLSKEELRSYRQQRSSEALQIELSYWSDLAKWLFLQTWKQERTLILQADNKEPLPHFLLLSTADVQARMELPLKQFSSLLYSLARSPTEPPIHLPPLEPIQSIVYSSEAAEMRLLGEAGQENQPLPTPKHPEKALSLKDWLYEEGFFPKHLEKTTGMTLKGEAIGHFLSQNLQLVKRLLGEKIELQRHPLVYTLHFDERWNLSVVASLFAPQDLSAPQAHLFGEWAYLPKEDRFYRVDSPLFHEALVVIPAENVSAFVTRSKSFLNTQEGFKIFLRSVESSLSYFIDIEYALHFERRLVEDHSLICHDFGSWIYVQGEGFYQKKQSEVALPIQAGRSIAFERVSDFIDEYAQELQLIPKFFTSISPIKKVGLSVQSEGDALVVMPEYQLTAHFKKEELVFYQRHVYVRKEGFYKIAFPPKMPPELEKKCVFKQGLLEFFYTQLYPQISSFVTHMHSRIRPAGRLDLFLESLMLLRRGEVELSLCYKKGVFQCPLQPLWAALKNGQRFVFTELGALDLSESHFDCLRILQQRHFLNDGKIHLSMLELFKLLVTQPLESEHTAVKQQLEALLNFQTPQPPNIEGMHAVLRSYQHIGVQWLWFLYWNGLSGLLCDDMGLGKTHQVMALIAAIMSAKTGPVHFLVICPTSVLYHWQEKLSSYLPHLRVAVFHGSTRMLEDFKQDYDLLLTSYGIWRNDCALLESIEFELAVFDEIHFAKSQSSRLHSSLHKVRSRMRLGLTGTPIENNLWELKALFDLVLPSYMPEEKIFKELFARPIEKPQEPKERLTAKERLSRYIHPFVLRRTKEQVLDDLPEKIEEISYCDLSQQQRELYNELLKTEAQQGSAFSFVHIFALLSKLKQICDHPACYLKDVGNYRSYTSGKWELFTELLNEALSSGQKVVVFSQYLHMLDIIEAHLQENGIGFASIRGATIDRAQECRRFAQEESCKVFVASLQAAGVGIDLTAASVVIHYDRWWNASKEQQATDRVHRIGQRRGVQVFKMVTHATFEERIHEMIKEKGRLMADVVGVDEADVFKHLTQEELRSLLSLS